MCFVLFIYLWLHDYNGTPGEEDSWGYVHAGKAAGFGCGKKWCFHSLTVQTTLIAPANGILFLLVEAHTHLFTLSMGVPWCTVNVTKDISVFQLKTRGHHVTLRHSFAWFVLNLRLCFTICDALLSARLCNGTMLFLWTFFFFFIVEVSLDFPSSPLAKNILFFKEYAGIWFDKAIIEAHLWSSHSDIKYTFYIYIFPGILERLMSTFFQCNELKEGIYCLIRGAIFLVIWVSGNKT